MDLAARKDLLLPGLRGQQYKFSFQTTDLRLEDDKISVIIDGKDCGTVLSKDEIEAKSANQLAHERIKAICSSKNKGPAQ